MADAPPHEDQTPAHGRLWHIGQIVWYTLVISAMLALASLCIWGAYFFE